MLLEAAISAYSYLLPLKEQRSPSEVVHRIVARLLVSRPAPPATLSRRVDLGRLLPVPVEPSQRYLNPPTGHSSRSREKPSSERQSPMPLEQAHGVCLLSRQFERLVFMTSPAVSGEIRLLPLLSAGTFSASSPQPRLALPPRPNRCLSGLVSVLLDHDFEVCRLPFLPPPPPQIPQGIYYLLT